MRERLHIYIYIKRDSLTSCCSKAKDASFPYNLFIAWRGKYGFMPFPRALTRSERQAASSRIMLVTVFAKSLADQVSIPGQKMVLDASLLNTQHYKVRIKGKWSKPGKGIAPSLTPQCSSYWVALYYGWPTYIYIYIYAPEGVCVCERERERRGERERESYKVMVYKQVW